MSMCNGCDKTLEEARAQDKPILTIGQNTYVLWDSWHIVRNGVLQHMRDTSLGVPVRGNEEVYHEQTA